MSTNQHFAFESEQEARRVLQEEGKRLEELARKIWRKWYATYSPVKYIRHYNAEKAIKLGEVKKLDDDTFGIELTWVDDLAYHDSVVTDGKPQGHAIMLISEGWKTKKANSYPVNPDNKYFPKGIHYFAGTNYLSELEQAFNSGKHKGITLEIQWAGNKFKKQRKQPNVLR